MGHQPKENNINMMPDEDKIFRAFSECLLKILDGVPTYEYMTNLNVYLAVICMLQFSTFGYLVLTSQPTVFNIQCGMLFVTPRNTGIHPIMPNPATTAAILYELVRTHKQGVRLFNNYYTVNRACKKVISKLIPKKIYKSLLSHIIGFANFTSLEILTHLITEYAEFEEEDVHDINSENE